MEPSIGSSWMDNSGNFLKAVTLLITVLEELQLDLKVGTSSTHVIIVIFAQLFSSKKQEKKKNQSNLNLWPKKSPSNKLSKLSQSNKQQF